jgi:hypothetical protein
MCHNTRHCGWLVSLCSSACAMPSLGIRQPSVLQTDAAVANLHSPCMLQRDHLLLLAADLPLLLLWLHLLGLL